MKITSRGGFPKPVGRVEHYIRLEEHLDVCNACREAMLNHANMVSVNQVAHKRGLPVKDILRDLDQIAQSLTRDARSRGMSLKELVRELLTN